MNRDNIIARLVVERKLASKNSAFCVCLGRAERTALCFTSPRT